MKHGVVVRTALARQWGVEAVKVLARSGGRRGPRLIATPVKLGRPGEMSSSASTSVWMPQREPSRDAWMCLVFARKNP